MLIFEFLVLIFHTIGSERNDTSLLVLTYLTFLLFGLTDCQDVQNVFHTTTVDDLKTTPETLGNKYHLPFHP